MGVSPRDYTYTAQRDETSLPGLMDYRARYYDVYLNRFIQADTIVPEPGKSQTLNRFMYTIGNPVKFNDPSGHDAGCAGMQCTSYAAVHSGDPTATQVSLSEFACPAPHTPIIKNGPVVSSTGFQVDATERRNAYLTGSTILYGMQLFNSSALYSSAFSTPKDQHDLFQVVPGAEYAVGSSTYGNITVNSLPYFVYMDKESFSLGNWRENVIAVTGIDPNNKKIQAHHMLPQQIFKEYSQIQELLNGSDISLHDPRWGTWWGTGEYGTHSTQAQAYNQTWRNMLSGYDLNNLTMNELLYITEVIGREYGLLWSNDAFYQYPSE